MQKRVLLYFALLFFFCINSSFSIENKILLKIENQIITSLDVNNEFKYLIALNPNIKNSKREDILRLSKRSIIQEKINQLGLSKTLADYYTDSVPAQSTGAHIAEYAKLVNGKVQPSLVNELMSPAYDFDRGILSKITFGFLEDLGYDVDYNQIESSFLLEMSENTDISSNPASSNYDQIKYQKKRRRCPHCDASHTDEIKNTILPDRTSE